MVSLPGDIAPERFRGFYSLEPPQGELMRRQAASFPPWNFLSQQGGLRAGIANPNAKLRALPGFKRTTTNFYSVQNGPAYLKMRLQDIARKNQRLEAERLERDRIAVHSVANRKKAAKKAITPYFSKAAGQALKQAGTTDRPESTEAGIDILQQPLSRSDIEATKRQNEKELAALKSPEAMKVAIQKERLSASAKLAVEKEMAEQKRAEAADAASKAAAAAPNAGYSRFGIQRR
jgi:hypothetical protein